MSKKAQRPGRPKLPKEVSYNLRAIRCTDAEWELFNKAAKRADLTVSAWLRDVASRAAQRILKK
jgi:hypothetical protein